MSDESRQAISELLTALANIKARLSNSSARQVRSTDVHDAAKELISSYFADVRPTMKQSGLDDETLSGTDKWMQDLLELAQRRALRSIWRETIRSMNQELKGLEVAALTASGSTSPTSTRSLDGKERRIALTLGALVPSAACSYEQACLDLRDASRKSYRGSAAEIREALREILDRLAPDAEVKAQAGFRLESGQSRPTMKQKVRYIFASRGQSKTAAETPETAIGLIEDRVGSLARSVYSRSSLSTHVGTTLEEVRQIKAYVDVVLCDLLEIA